ncbi:hypothetical protein B0H19DRAFT_1258102 [Mycena capillaripes]|nr:hypothetical protein B0H19DRAFT_1258102 [Mycena capillaripes]
MPLLCLGKSSSGGGDKGSGVQILSTATFFVLTTTDTHQRPAAFGVDSVAMTTPPGGFNSASWWPSHLRRRPDASSGGALNGQPIGWRINVNPLVCAASRRARNFLKVSKAFAHLLLRPPPLPLPLPTRLCRKQQAAGTLGFCLWWMRRRSPIANARTFCTPPQLHSSPALLKSTQKPLPMPKILKYPESVLPENICISPQLRRAATMCIACTSPTLPPTHRARTSLTRHALTTAPRRRVMPPAKPRLCERLPVRCQSKRTLIAAFAPAPIRATRCKHKDAPAAFTTAMPMAPAPRDANASTSASRTGFAPAPPLGCRFFTCTRARVMQTLVCSPHPLLPIAATATFAAALCDGNTNVQPLCYAPRSAGVMRTPLMFSRPPPANKNCPAPCEWPAQWPRCCFRPCPAAGFAPQPLCDADAPSPATDFAPAPAAIPARCECALPRCCSRPHPRRSPGTTQTCPPPLPIPPLLSRSPPPQDLHLRTRKYRPSASGTSGGGALVTSGLPQRRYH